MHNSTLTNLKIFIDNSIFTAFKPFFLILNVIGICSTIEFFTQIGSLGYLKHPNIDSSKGSGNQHFATCHLYSRSQADKKLRAHLKS